VIWHQWIGIAGTVLLLSAYGLLQSKRLSADPCLQAQQAWPQIAMKKAPSLGALLVAEAAFSSPVWG